jgi:hypothetical protein
MVVYRVYREDQQDEILSEKRRRNRAGGIIIDVIPWAGCRSLSSTLEGLTRRKSQFQFPCIRSYSHRRRRASLLFNLDIQQLGNSIPHPSLFPYMTSVCRFLHFSYFSLSRTSQPNPPSSVGITFFPFF